MDFEYRARLCSGTKVRFRESKLVALVLACDFVIAYGDRANALEQSRLLGVKQSCLGN